VAQPVPTRDAPKAGWSFPRPNLRINLTITGVVLALAAWMLQSYFAAAAAARSELDRSLQFAKLQREMWLIEYNASLIRVPRNERVTARAAFHVVENTYAMLAWSDAAGQFSPGKRAEALQQARDSTDQAKKLFDGRDYAALVGELNAVSQLFETRMQEAPIVTGSQNAGLTWWQHLFPAAFLAGMVFCVLDRRARGRSAAREE
jgi:hypothetical protein